MKSLLTIALALLLPAAAALAQGAAEPRVAAPPAAAGEEYKLEPTFEDQPELTLAGIAVYTTPGNANIPQLWGKFQDVMAYSDPEKLASWGLETDRYAYGLEQFPPSFDKKREFSYMACTAVVDIKKLPAHLLTRTLPPARYAVFKVPGGVEGLGAAFPFIYGKWLPNSGYTLAMPVDMERYNTSAASLKKNGLTVEIMVPIKLIDKKAP